MNRSPFLVAGNWKMFKTPEQTRAFVRDFFKICPADKRKSFALFPTTLCLPALKEALGSSETLIGAQNCYFATEGAFTGETSPRTLKEFGSQMVLIGHSERRQLFGESDEVVAKKVTAALQEGLEVVLCIGETLQERQANQTYQVLQRQVAHALAGTSQSSHLTIAYEPVWAIGTGQVATPTQAEEAHQFVRSCVQKVVGTSNVRILYGGSVKPENAADLAKMPNIDGFLVGGASLKPQDFWSIGLTSGRI